MMQSCSLVLIDDHVVFRDSLKILLRPHSDLQVAGEASGAPDAYSVAAAARADVVLLDLNLPGANGLSMLRELRERAPSSRFLILTMVDEPSRVAEAFAAGALGYATKDEPFENVARAIRAVRDGQRYLSARISSAEVEECRLQGPPPQSLEVLTVRERDVFELMVQGATTPQIATRLELSPRTVECHRSRVLKKLQARSTVDLLRIAARRGWLQNERN